VGDAVGTATISPVDVVGTGVYEAPSLSAQAESASDIPAASMIAVAILRPTRVMVSPAPRVSRSENALARD
jgi:hypothetical protein